MITSEQIVALEATGIETPTTKQGMLDALMGIENSIKHEATTLEKVAYEVGRLRGQRMLDEGHKIAGRTKRTWSEVAKIRKK